MSVGDAAGGVCPYCGETIELTVDSVENGYETVEDCPVCCRPMVVTATVGPGGGMVLDVRREDE
jgi:hypothetical protein